MPRFSKAVKVRKLDQAEKSIQKGLDLLKDVAERDNHWGFRMAVARVSDNMKGHLATEIEDSKRRE